MKSILNLWIFVLVESQSQISIDLPKILYDMPILHGISNILYLMTTTAPAVVKLIFASPSGTESKPPAPLDHHCTLEKEHFTKLRKIQMCPLLKLTGHQLL